ncbi:MAG: putative HD phosphohydrolase [Candidatus Aldehydirespiratoraceae bacterium]|jgi:predicted HD phosphohydrolase
MTIMEPTEVDANPESFRRMDESTAAQWAHIGERTATNQGRVADRLLMLLDSLSSISDGFITDQLTHCLQTATMAERAGADDEMIFGSLCHDIGKAISVPNHGAISAEMIKPYVRDDVYQSIKNHQDFQGKHYYHHFDVPTTLRDQFADESWFALCEQFTDDWDQQAFDPGYDTLPLSHFEPLIRELTARARF